MNLNLSKHSGKHGVSRYICWNILFCWGLGLWAALCATDRYRSELFETGERNFNISMYSHPIGQTNRTKEAIKNATLITAQNNFSWDAIQTSQSNFRVSEIIIILSIVLLIAIIQRFVRRELNAAVQTSHGSLRDEKIVQTTESDFAVTHCNVLKDYKKKEKYFDDNMNFRKVIGQKTKDINVRANIRFGARKEAFNAGGDFQFPEVPFSAEKCFMQRCVRQYLKQSVNVSLYNNSRVWTTETKTVCYFEGPPPVESTNTMRSHFISSSPEFQKFLLNSSKFQYPYLYLGLKGNE